jgi:hypothetical protein
MGRDRLLDYQSDSADAVVSTDVSCLMHLQGLARRDGIALPMMHVAQVLAEENNKSRSLASLGTTSERSARFPVIDHAAASAVFNDDEARVDWHDDALWFVREKRDRAVELVPEWEALRELASSIKEHTLSQLDEYLITFESAATANGATVHWARDAEEHNRIVHEILVQGKVRHLVKSKSMLTEECGLNAYLESRGVDVVDTDLGERIVQLRRERPEPHRDAGNSPQERGDWRYLRRSISAPRLV